jgi:hypothetical protein
MRRCVGTRLAIRRRHFRHEPGASRVTRHRFCGHNSLLCCSEPGRANAGTRDEPAGTRGRGSCESGFRQWGGTQHNSRCVWRTPKQIGATGAERSEHRRRRWSFMTAVPNEAKAHLGGVASSSDLHPRGARASAARITVRVSPMFQRPERSRSVGDGESSASPWESSRLC